MLFVVIEAVNRSYNKSYSLSLMNTKISKLSELSDIIVKKSRLDEGVLNFVTRFKLGILLKSFPSLKEQGYSLLSIISIILIRLG